VTLMGSVGQVGQLLTYGANFGEQVRRAASYVDRILKGAKPGGRTAHQVRAGDQPKDCEGARPDDPAVAAGAGGPDPRMRPLAVS
jgi:hypothetical protein